MDVLLIVHALPLLAFLYLKDSAFSLCAMTQSFMNDSHHMHVYMTPISVVG